MPARLAVPIPITTEQRQVQPRIDQAIDEWSPVFVAAAYE